MKIEVTERGLKEIYGLKKVDETLTWRQITKKYSKKNIYLMLSRDPFWKWADRNIPEYTISHTCNYELENFMTVAGWENYFSSQSTNLHKR